MGYKYYKEYKDKEKCGYEFDILDIKYTKG